MQWQSGNTILYCQHWEASQAFYLHILGLKPVYRREDWFLEMRLLPGCHLSLADASRCTIAAGEGRGLTLSLECEDLVAAHHSLKRQQQRCTPIHDNSWRQPYFYVHDPEGNRIEIWSRRP